MKKALCLAIILLLAGPVAFTAAGLWVNGKENDVVVTKSTVYGDPEAAAGVQVRVTSQWEGHLIWDTVYTVGSGVAESSFRFSSMGETWRSPGTDAVDINFYPSWGMIHTDGTSSGEFDPDRYPMSRVLRSVMERTAPGQRRTETVHLKDFYDYYPLNVLFNSQIMDVYYNEGFSEDVSFSEFLQILIGEATVQITMEKDQDGKVVDVKCNDQDAPGLVNCAVFGRKGCYHTYYVDDWSNGKVGVPGENYGISYFPYVEKEDGRSGLTLDPGQARLIYRLQPGIYTVEMGLNETLGELYLVTREEQEFYLSVFDIQGEDISLKQKLMLRSVAGEPGEKDNPYWAQLSVQDNGVLMIWRDGSFVFAARQGKEFMNWGLEYHPSVLNTNMIAQDFETEIQGEMAPREGQAPVNQDNHTFPVENVWAFDGQRLAIASFVDWRSLSVDLTVYTEEGLVWYGVCEHSGDVFKQQSNSLLRLAPPATFKEPSDIIIDRMHHNGVDVNELLGIEWIDQK
ncbi:MAG: hypothetical protein J1E01_01815 [Acetatifactor sp.]|nr:hypothetical protein [Acetatifactor sp.]